MRTVCLLLVLANVVFYAYAFIARERSVAEAPGPELQLNADRISIVKRSERGANAPPGLVAPPPPSGPAACLEWGVMTGADIARAEAALARLELRTDGLVRLATDAVGYWVHIPSLKTKAELDKKISEVKSFGIVDVSAVQEPGPGANAISLGIFSTEEAAQARLAALKAKGVRSAVMERRESIVKQARFFLREPNEDIVARLTELQQAFPGSALKAGPCPATQ